GLLSRKRETVSLRPPVLRTYVATLKTEGATVWQEHAGGADSASSSTLRRTAIALLGTAGMVAALGVFSSKHIPRAPDERAGTLELQPPTGGVAVRAEALPSAKARALGPSPVLAPPTPQTSVHAAKAAPPGN